MLVKEFMTSNVITASPSMMVKEAAELMNEKNISVLPVVDADHKLVGLITESDFVGNQIDVPHALVSIKRLLGESFHDRDIEDVFNKAKNNTLEKVMSTNLHTVTQDNTLNDVVNFMISKNIKRLPVVDGEKLVGIITRKNIIQAFSKSN